MQTLFPGERPGNASAHMHGSARPRPSASQWDLIKARLRETLSPEDFSKWIAPLEARQVSEREILIPVPNMVFYQGLLDDFLDPIETCKAQLGIDQVLIRFEIEGGGPVEADHEIGFKTQRPNPKTEDVDLAPHTPTPQRFAENEAAPEVDGGRASKTSLNRTYVFDTFVRGPSNQFAHASCLAVAEAPGRTYNPLFIYGSTGLGKTHLLHAVGNRVLQANPNAVVTYISSERFMNEMIYCLRFNKMWDFRQKYRHCDVFMVDDIQFISGKERTQEEFFHTFNTLYEAKKQIVITSDLFPQDIPDIEDRLRNRFQWGLIADIQPPDVEHRMAILINKAEQLGFRLAEDVALYIASHAKRNVRELEGALHRIAAFAALHGRPIDLDLAAETFQNVLGEPPKRLTIEAVQRVVADHYKLRVSDLKSKKRQRALTLPRQIAMFLARNLTNSSFPEIGERFGGKDHTTVMHAVRKIEKDRANDLQLKTDIDALERTLEQLN